MPSGCVRHASLTRLHCAKLQHVSDETSFSKNLFSTLFPSERRRLLHDFSTVSVFLFFFFASQDSPHSIRRYNLELHIVVASPGGSKGWKEKGDDEHETGREERNTAYFAFYSRVPDSPESGALVTVVNCCLDWAPHTAPSRRVRTNQKTSAIVFRWPLENLTIFANANRPSPDSFRIVSKSRRRSIEPRFFMSDDPNVSPNYERTLGYLGAICFRNGDCLDQVEPGRDLLTKSCQALPSCPSVQTCRSPIARIFLPRGIVRLRTDPASTRYLAPARRFAVRRDNFPLEEIRGYVCVQLAGRRPTLPRLVRSF